MPANWINQWIDAWNSHDGSQVAALMAKDGTYVTGTAAVHEGREAVKAYVEMNHQSSSDYHFAVLSAVESGNRFAIEWDFHGTNTGEIPGFPATQRPYHLQGVSIGELDDAGKVKTNRDYWNLAEYMTQVGILSTPGA